jgi:hypothetical protein
MHRSQPLINVAWSPTTEQPVLRARSSQNVHLLTYPVHTRTISRLLRQAEICFRPIPYDARDSHRAFGKQHLEKPTNSTSMAGCRMLSPRATKVCNLGDSMAK